MKEESTETFLSEQDEGYDLFSYIEDEDNNKIEDFLKNKPRIWEYRDNNNDKSTALHIAVFKKSYKITKRIIDHCKEYKDDCDLEKFVNVSNDKGVTALHYASFIGNIKIIELLIKNGAYSDIKTTRGLNIIHYSAQGNKPNSLMYFYIKFKDDNIESLKKLIKEEDKGGSTPLHWAAYSNAEDALMYLINLDIFKNENERQEFINKKDKQGYTPLHLSVTSKSRRIVMKLLQSGAKIDIEDEKHRKPLDIAVSKRYQEIIEILKNNQNCQICNFKAPVKQIKKSKQNIFIVLAFQIITIIILYVYPSLIVIALYNKIDDEENKDNDFFKYFKICCFFIYNIFLLVFLILYSILLCKDPGEKKKNDLKELKKLLENELDENKKGDDLNLAKYCYKCFIKKEKYSKHCIVCDKCYDDFDHHCYWINKCVAKKNYNLFISFLFITFFYLCFVLIIDILGFYNYFKKIKPNIKYSFVFSFINLEYPKNILGDNNLYALLASIISLLLINLIFLIPVFLLLILHLKVCCSNLKIQRNISSSSINNEYLLGNNVESSVLNN